jgi:peptide/nickel transport system ATP-binding protein
MREGGAAPALVAEGLVRHFGGRRGERGGGGQVVKAVDGVSLQVAAGETYGLLGRSGAGKSTLARLLCGLERPDAGRVLVGGKCLADASGYVDGQLRRRVQLVFQDAFASLDPVHTVRWLVAEPLAVAGVLPRIQRRARVAELLAAVELPTDEAFLARKPRELSGGERQRVAMARALACEPLVLVLDEPVSALDAAIRGQVLALLTRLAERLRLAVVLIAHDVGVVQRIAARVGVMLAGRVVEEGPAADVLGSPRHPYTAALVAAGRWRAEVVREGGAWQVSGGCAYAVACSRRQAVCAGEPELLATPGGRRVACHFPLEP